MVGRHSLVIGEKIVINGFLFLDQLPEVKVELDADRRDGVHVELERRIVDKYFLDRRQGGGQD